MENRKKLIKASTVPGSLETFCKGQLRWLSNYYEVVAVSSPLSELALIERREGVRTVAVPMERHISLSRDMKSLFRMIAVFRREKPYIVHSMTPKAGLICMIAAWICRVPVRIHTYTGLVFPTASGLRRKILILTDRILCLCATYINPEGRGVANDLWKYRITRKPLHIIGNGNVRGIDLDYWNAELFEDRRPAMRGQLGIGSSDFVFLFVGRLVRDKGINELVEAFGRLSSEYSQVRLLLVGAYESELDPLETETLKEIESNPRIIAPGSKQDVRPYYASSDLFVFPSYREGFPNTVLEAGAMGLPCIATDINGCNEIITEGENGILVPPHDVAALYGAMKRFLDNPECAKGLAAGARALVANRFEQQYLWNELLKTYMALI